MPLTCSHCTVNAIQHIRDLLADEETIFVSSEIIDWLDEQIAMQIPSLGTMPNGVPSQAYTIDYFAPWSLRFDRDGTEDIAVVLEADGEELAYSRPFWLPEGDDPVPSTLAAMRLMVAAPKLLTSLIECARLLADHDEQNGEEGDVYREALAVITEAIGRTA